MLICLSLSDFGLHIDLAYIYIDARQDRHKTSLMHTHTTMLQASYHQARTNQHASLSLARLTALFLMIVVDDVVEVSHY